MSARRLLGLAAVATVAGAVGLAAVPSGAGLSPDVRVIDSHGAAAVVGALSRVPAESDGGAVYSFTALTLDKTIARAAGFTAGPLAELFLESSSEHYRNPSLVTAQYPPAGNIPAEATFDGARSPDGTPASGGGGRLHALATETPSAAADATGAGAVAPDVTVGSSTSSSAGELLADGTLVTTARADATDVRIGEVLTLASVTTTAEARVPRTGTPTTSLQVTLAGVALAGVPAEITPDGIRPAGQAPVSPLALAGFNAALAQLQAQGITVVAAPLAEETTAGAARAQGGALVLRYRVADQIGGDEEITLAPAAARSAVSRRQPEPAPVEVPDLPVDGLGPATATAPPPTPAAAAARPAMASAAPKPLPFNGSPAYGGPVAPPSPSLTPAPAPAPAPVAADGMLLAAGRGPDPTQRLRSGYGVLLVALFAGVAAVTALFRARPA